MGAQYYIFSRIAEGGLWEKRRTNVCHTPDDRLLEFPKDIATMFLTIKYRDNLPTLKKVLKAIPEIENIEEDTYDVMWNFLDKRMMELKENVLVGTINRGGRIIIPGGSDVIQPGDTLFQISLERYGDAKEISRICALNGIKEDEIIYPGQVIVLP